MKPYELGNRKYIPSFNGQLWIIETIIQGIDKDLVVPSGSSGPFTLLPRVPEGQLYFVDVSISADFSSSGDLDNNWLNIFTIPDNTILKFFAREQVGTFTAHELYQPEVSFNLDLGGSDNFQAIASGFLISVQRVD